MWCWCWSNGRCSVCAIVTEPAVEKLKARNSRPSAESAEDGPVCPGKRHPRGRAAILASRDPGFNGPALARGWVPPRFLSDQPGSSHGTLPAVSLGDRARVVAGERIGRLCRCGRTGSGRGAGRVRRTNDGRAARRYNAV
ncbi:MAG: hypothetical protein DWH79_00805 [Planctomycetota bacterium]|nr:MAG: hypothetical protein DWH79_00805 [Planctomycetota bacterium]